MKKMAASNVLIVGAQGLGVEIGRVPSGPTYHHILIFLLSQGYRFGRCQVRYRLRSRTSNDTRSKLTSMSFQDLVTSRYD